VDLDPRDYEVALAEARANFAQAEASVRAQTPNVPITQTTQETSVATANLAVESAAANVAAAEQTYRSSLADLAQSEANAANATAEEERYRPLVAKQEVSREVYDQRATEARSLSAVVQSRRATADAALKSVTQAQASLAQARRRAEEALHNLPRQIAIQHATLGTREANLKAAKAQVDQALLNLSYCRSRHPPTELSETSQCRQAHR
jgi:membrane fusion protein (multidrug efflux system)